MPEGELFPSERGGKILSFGGYLYNRHSESKDGMRTYWMFRRRPQCKKRATTDTPAGISLTFLVTV